jgi:hypothetical protein
MGFLEVNSTSSQEGASNTDATVLALQEERSPDANASMLDPIVAYIQQRFMRSKMRRQSDEHRWLESYRNYRGLYGPDVQFSEEEKSRFFVKVTKTKVLAAYAQVVDVLFAGGKFPIGVEPTPVTVGNVPDAVHIDPKAPKDALPSTIARKELGPLAKALSKIKDVLTDGAGKTPTSATWEPVKEAAKLMERKIHDQLAESSADSHLRYAAFELALFGHCVIKGPFVTEKEYPKWSEDGTYSPVVNQVPRISSTSIWNFYPDADAKNMNDAEYVIERHKMSKSQLRGLKRRPHFRASSIDLAISYNANYMPESWESILEDDKDQVANESYEVLEFWGVIDAEVLEDTELSIPEELSGNDEFSVNAWTCNGQVLRLVLNPFTPQRIPYHAAPYELNPYSFFGIGVAENMSDTQLIMNGVMRMAIDNLALSGNLVFEIDETNMVAGQSMDVFPGKIFRRQGGQTGQSVFGIKFPTVTNELLQMYDKARQLTDEATSMPSYAHGGVGIQGMGRTAAGMSMLMGAAGLSIKATVRNLDDYILSPLGKALFAWNMQFDFNKDIIGDLDIVARGTESLMRNEVRSQKILQFLQLTANPIDAPFVKRDYLLRELATSLDLEEDKVVNDTREAVIQAQIMKQMNDIQGIGPQTAPTGAPSVSDPTGNGGGVIGPGMAPEPGAMGFTGAGGGANGGNPSAVRAESANV